MTPAPEGLRDRVIKTEHREIHRFSLLGVIFLNLPECDTPRPRGEE